MVIIWATLAALSFEFQYYGLCIWFVLAAIYDTLGEAVKALKK